MFENIICEFGLMRHAQTEWNALGRIQGQDDSPLTSAGCEMARSWGQGLRGRGYEVLISSDLGRARRTAELVNQSLGLELLLEPGLREQDFGEWSGSVWNDLVAASPDGLASLLALGWEFRPPGGESRSELAERSILTLRGLSKRHAGRKALIVCHEGTLRSVLYRLHGRRFLPDEPKLLESYRLHRVAARPDSLECLELNLPLEAGS